jgi:predicted amidophosphoribosyltransferase
MKYLICLNCAYTTDDWNRKLCEYCRSELAWQCANCKEPIREKPAIYCSTCGTKLRVSIVPIQ